MGARAPPHPLPQLGPLSGFDKSSVSQSGKLVPLWIFYLLEMTRLSFQSFSFNYYAGDDAMPIPISSTIRSCSKSPVANRDHDFQSAMRYAEAEVESGAGGGVRRNSLSSVGDFELIPSES